MDNKMTKREKLEASFIPIYFICIFIIVWLFKFYLIASVFTFIANIFFLLYLVIKATKEKVKESRKLEAIIFTIVLLIMGFIFLYFEYRPT